MLLGYLIIVINSHNLLFIIFDEVKRKRQTERIVLTKSPKRHRSPLQTPQRNPTPLARPRPKPHESTQTLNLESLTYKDVVRYELLDLPQYLRHDPNQLLPVKAGLVLKG